MMSNILQIDIDFPSIVTHRTIINFGIDTIYVWTQFEFVSLLIKFLIIYKPAICHFIAPDRIHKGSKVSLQ